MSSLPSRKAQQQYRYYHGLQKLLVEIKGGGCTICGYDGVAALHFHHLDPSTKTRSFNQRTWGPADLVDPSFLIELGSTVLLCANCHAEEHERLSHERIFPSEPQRLDEGDSPVCRD